MAWRGAQMAEAVGVEVDAPCAHRLEAPGAAVAFGDGDVGKLPEPVGVARRADAQAPQQIAIGIALEDGEPGKSVGADASRAQAPTVGDAEYPGELPAVVRTLLPAVLAPSPHGPRIGARLHRHVVDREQHPPSQQRTRATTHRNSL